MVAWRYLRVLLFAAVAVGCSAQNSSSVLYLRLGRQIFEQRMQPPAPEEGWSAALHKLYIKAGIPPYQVVEQAVPGSSQKMVLCTIAGRGDSVLIVSASLVRPKDDDAANVAWASLAMLPLLAESLNGVSTQSTILFIAFPGDSRHSSGSLRYAGQLNEAQRKQTKAAVEVSDIGRGATTFEVKRNDRNLADWLATAALALRLPAPTQVAEWDTVHFADAKAFRSVAIPAITISSQPQRTIASFSAVSRPVNKLYLDSLYETYQTLCVFLLNLDRAARGASPKSTIASPASSKTAHTGPIFTEEQAERMIAGQINDARTIHGVRTLWPSAMPDLRGLVCDMAKRNQLDSVPFESHLKQKQLSGEVAVFSGSYPSLLPEQLQALKVGRYQRLSVGACIVPSAEAKNPTYWIAVLAYE